MRNFYFALFYCFLVSVDAQNYTEYATGNSNDLDVTPTFGICMMGGASENDNAMIWFLERANGGDVVVLRASGSDGYNNYMYSQLGVNINSVTTFVIHNEDGALDPYVLEKVENAEAIWFAGGDQYDYVSYFKDNAMEDALNSFVNDKQGVIGGTSAGMAILGSGYFSAENGTVTNAQALSNPYHNRMTLGYNDFLELPFLNNVITDTHYDDPDRRARHTTFLARYATDNSSRAFGIACNEYTAVCVDANGLAHVYGDYPNYPEFAYFLQSNCTETFAPESCVNGQALTWNRAGEAVKVAKIAGTQNGTNTFDLSDWTTTEGATWENWYVNNGSFLTSDTSNPDCDLLSVSDVEQLEINISPNPFKHQIKIQGISEAYELEIFDINGKMIYSASLYNEKSIDLSYLQSGLYLVEVRSKTKTKQLKLIKR
jgi:cyanophycinase-like exopeptidase